MENAQITQNAQLTQNSFFIAQVEQADTITKAVNNIKGLVRIENTTYIARILLAKKIQTIARTAVDTTEGFNRTGFYLPSDNAYRRLSADDKKKAKLKDYYERTFETSLGVKWATIANYLTAYNYLEGQSPDNIGLSVRDWVRLCKGKTQHQLKLPNSVRTPTSQLVIPERARPTAAQRQERSQQLEATRQQEVTRIREETRREIRLQENAPAVGTVQDAVAISNEVTVDTLVATADATFVTPNTPEPPSNATAPSISIREITDEDEDYVDFINEFDDDSTILAQQGTPDEAFELDKERVMRFFKTIPVPLTELKRLWEQSAN